MALADLATTADLTNRKIDTSDTTLVETLLTEVSTKVREAAGCAITLETSTIDLEGGTDKRLRLPGGPVTSVTSVAIDGTTVTDWKLVSGSLWRAWGWAAPALYPTAHSIFQPSTVTVTYVHGFTVVPEDIVGLVCMFVAKGIADANENGYTGHAGVISHTEAIDDWRETTQYADGSDSIEIPERTRLRLRERFGGGAYVTGGRRL